MSTIPIPKLSQGAKNQDLARGLLAISDLANQLSLLSDALRNSKPPSILTGCVRRMSVSLQSILVENKGRLSFRFAGARSGHHTYCKPVQHRGDQAVLDAPREAAVIALIGTPPTGAESGIILARRSTGETRPKGSCLIDSSVRIARDNWNYREQNAPSNPQNSSTRATCRICSVRP